MKKRHKVSIAFKLIVKAIVTIILAIKNDNFEEPKKRKPQKEQDDETPTPTEL